MTFIRTHARWAIDIVLEIDIHKPGFCGFYLRTSDERRQVISAYLSERSPDAPSMAKVGAFLTSADHRAILERTYSKVPKGLRGALARSGAMVLERSFYRLLFTHLSEPRHGEIIQTIQRMPNITGKKLTQLHILPQELCSNDLVEALGCPSKAEELVATFDLVVKQGVNGKALAAALCRARSEGDIGKVFKRWVLKAHCPAHPVEESECYRPISSPFELHRLAIEWQNCARRYVVDLLQGTHAFAVFSHDGRRVIAHLMRDEDGVWEREGVWGPRNTHPTSGISNALDEYLTKHGVRSRPYAAHERTEWDFLRRILRSGDQFEMDLNAFDLEFSDLLATDVDDY